MIDEDLFIETVQYGLPDTDSNNVKCLHHTGYSEREKGQ